VDEDVARFWHEFEEETGERVEARAMGELHQEDGGPSVWFLLVLTDRSFWFRQVPTENWLTSLFQPRTLSPAKAQEHTLRIPREDLLALEEPKPKGWFTRSAYPVLTLSWRSGGATRARRFSMDPTTDLLPKLRELLSPASREAGR